MPDNNQYAYIVGRLRALETKMLDSNLLERMLDANTAKEAFRALNDAPLVSGSIGDYEVNDFNKVFVSALGRMKKLILEMAPCPAHMDFLWLKYDYHNLKVILKAQLTGRGYADVEHALIEFGTVSMEDWQAYLLEGKKIELTPELGKTIADVKAAYEKDSNPQVIDMSVDQHYLDSLRLITASINSPMLSTYLSRLIDFTNLKTFVRSKELKKDATYMQSLILSGGFIARDIFIHSFDKTYSEFHQLLEKKMHADGLVKALADFIDSKTLTAFEKRVYALQQDFLADSVKIALGPEPVFAFFLRFENHLHIMRAVLIGKLNRLPLEDIRRTALAL